VSKYVPGGRRSISREPRAVTLASGRSNTHRHKSIRHDLRQQVLYPHRLRFEFRRQLDDARTGRARRRSERRDRREHRVALYEYFDTFTPFTLLLFSTLNASAISSSSVGEEHDVARNARRMSNCEGSRRELRVNPGAMSFSVSRWLFRSEFTFRVRLTVW
jgi:hypothetical protein